MMKRPPLLLRVLGVSAFVASFVVAAACSSATDSDGGGCTEIGKPCKVDDECCTANCMYQGAGSFCQSANAPAPACGRGGEGCTQNRHCCSGVCNGTVCSDTGVGLGDGGPPVDECVAEGNPCQTIFECCSANCTQGGVCGSAVDGGGGTGPGTCRLKNQSCTQGGQCCSGRCDGKACL